MFENQWLKFAVLSASLIKISIGVTIVNHPIYFGSEQINMKNELLRADDFDDFNRKSVNTSPYLIIYKPKLSDEENQIK